MNLGLTALVLVCFVNCFSDFLTQTSEEPYFWSPEKTLSDEGIHLVVCVHGLDG